MGPALEESDGNRLGFVGCKCRYASGSAPGVLTILVLCSGGTSGEDSAKNHGSKTDGSCGVVKSLGRP